MTLSEPMSLISLSVTVPLALPWPSVLKLPKSPTWRSSSLGAPWVLLWGLTICTHVLACNAHVWEPQGTAKLTVGSSRCAAVCVVTEGVDVHATLSVGIVAGDVP